MKRRLVAISVLLGNHYGVNNPLVRMVDAVSRALFKLCSAMDGIVFREHPGEDFRKTADLYGGPLRPVTRLLRDGETEGGSFLLSRSDKLREEAQ